MGTLPSGRARSRRWKKPSGSSVAAAVADRSCEKRHASPNLHRPVFWYAKHTFLPPGSVPVTSCENGASCFWSPMAMMRRTLGSRSRSGRFGSAQVPASSRIAVVMRDTTGASSSSMSNDRDAVATVQSTTRASAIICALVAAAVDLISFTTSSLA